MSDYNPFAEREKNEQTVREKPPLLAASAALDLFRNLCNIPKTEDAQEAWLKDVAVIGTDLEQLAKALWWSIGRLMVRDGDQYFYQEDYHDVGMPPERVVEEGHYDPLASCRAVSRACKRDSKYQWYHPSELVRGTTARFVAFGRHWRRGLKSPAYGRAKHNFWRDICYGTLEPSPERLTEVPGLLKVLEKLEKTIKSSPGRVDAITPTELEAAIDKLPAKWMVWEDLFGTYNLLDVNVLGDRMKPFGNNQYFHHSNDPGTMSTGAHPELSSARRLSITLSTLAS